MGPSGQVRRQGTHEGMATAAVAIGRALTDIARDELVSRSVSEYANANDVYRDAVGNGFIEYGRARREYEGMEREHALARFRSASRPLHWFNNPLYLRADLKVAICLLQLNDPVRAFALLKRVERDAGLHGFVSLEGDAAWTRGILLTHDGGSTPPWTCTDEHGCYLLVRNNERI